MGKDAVEHVLDGVIPWTSDLCPRLQPFPRYCRGETSVGP